MLRTAGPGGSNFERRVRAAVLALLLIGGLLPPVGGIPSHVVAAVLAIPLVLWEFLRALPRIHPALGFTVWVFVPLIFAELLRDDPTVVGGYGEEKFQALWSSTLLSAAAVALLRDRRAVVTFAKVWAVVGFLLAVTSLTGTLDAVSGRAGGYADSPIWLARAIGTGVIALLWLAWNRHARPLLTFLAGAVMVLGVLVTGSRGPTLGMAVGITVAAALAASRRGVRTVGVMAVAGVALLLASFLPATRDLRVFELMAGLGSGESDVQRAVMWERTFRLIGQEPGGVGYGNWMYEAPTILGRRYPHNLFLEVLAEAGWLVGALLILTVLFVLVRLVRRSRLDPIVSLVLAMLAAEAVAVSVSGDLNARTFFAMLTLGYVVGRWYPLPTRQPNRRSRYVSSRRS